MRFKLLRFLKHYEYGFTRIYEPPFLHRSQKPVSQTWGKIDTEARTSLLRLPPRAPMPSINVARTSSSPAGVFVPAAMRDSMSFERWPPTQDGDTNPTVSALCRSQIECAQTVP